VGELGTGARANALSCRERRRGPRGPSRTSGRFPRSGGRHRFSRVPALSFDSLWNYHSPAYAIGYLHGFMNDLGAAR